MQKGYSASDTVSSAINFITEMEQLAHISLSLNGREVSKELAAWSHSESCSEGLTVQVDTRDECAPQGLVVGLALFNIFVTSMDCGTGCTLSKSCDSTELCDDTGRGGRSSRGACTDWRGGSGRTW